MKDVSSVETMITNLFKYEPDASVNVYRHDNKLLGVVSRKEWESDDYKGFRSECKRYKAPEEYKVDDVSIIGRKIYIQIEENAQLYKYTFANTNENGEHFEVIMEPQSHDKEMELVKKYGAIIQMLPVDLG